MLYEDIIIKIFPLVDITDRVRLSWVSKNMFNICQTFLFDMFRHGVYLLKYDEVKLREKIINIPNDMIQGTYPRVQQKSIEYRFREKNYKTILSILLDPLAPKNETGIVLLPQNCIKEFLEVAKEQVGNYFPYKPESSRIIISNKSTCMRHYKYLSKYYGEVQSNLDNLFPDQWVKNLLPLGAINKIPFSSTFDLKNNIIVHSIGSIGGHSFIDRCYTLMHRYPDISYLFILERKRIEIFGGMTTLVN